MQEIKIKVSMKVGNMYEFLLRHSYKGVAGIIGVGFSLLALVYLCMNFGTLSDGKRVLLTFGALLFTVINPILIFFNATKQVKLNPTFKDELDYVLTEEEIKVIQKGQELALPWSEVQTVVETKRSIIIYLSKVRAFILPKDAMKEDTMKVRELAKSKGFLQKK